MPRPTRSPRRWAVGLFSLLSLWASIACGALSGGSATPPPTPAQPTGAGTAAPTNAPPTGAATAAPTATPLPLSTQPGELTLEQSLVFGSGSLIYTDTQAGLPALSSYTAQLVVTFAGTRDGQTEQWSKTYVMQASNDPPARQWTIETTGDPASPGVMFLAELGGTKYERRADAACTATAIEEGSSLSAGLELASFLTGVMGADESGTETVNDVAAAHYTFDQRALGEDGLTQSTGELWVAEAGDYIVKYLLTSTGGADYFGEGIEGTLTLDYALTGVNQPMTIQLPDDCPPGLVDAPLLPDAVNIVNVPGALAYDTAASLADAAAFYQEQLPALDWTPDAEPAVADAATILNYTQRERQLTVILSAEPTGASVNIIIRRLPE